MHSYWQSSPPDQVKAGILADWCDTLEDWKRDQVVWALRKWRNNNPNKKPNAGHILMLLKEARGKKIAKELPKTSPEPQRERVSAERAAEIIAEAGLEVKKFGGK